MTLFEMIELKGRLGDRRSLKMRLARYVARAVMTACANDPGLRRELLACVRAAHKERADERERELLACVRAAHKERADERE